MAVSFFWRQVLKRSTFMDIETTGLDPSRHAPLGAAHATYTGPIRETWFTYETAERVDRRPFYRKFGIKTEEAIKDTMEPFAKRMWQTAWEKARTGWLRRGGIPTRATKYFSKMFAKTARRGGILWTHNVRFDITQFGSQFAHPRAQQMLYEGAHIPGWRAWEPVSGRIYPTASKGMVDMKQLLYEHPKRAAATMSQWYASYRQMVKEVVQSGKPAVLDSLAITQAMMGMAQQRGAMKATGDVFTGSSLEALAEAFRVKVVGEPHLATTDVRTLRKLMPRILETTEALYKGKRLKGWMAEALTTLGEMQPEIATRNMERMFAQAQKEMLQVQKYRLKSGRYSTDLNELVGIYKGFWQDRSYYREGIVEETMAKIMGLAEPQLDEILLEKARIPAMEEAVPLAGKIARRTANLRRFLAGRNPLLVAGVAAATGLVAGAMMMPDRKKHNTIEALKSDNYASTHRHLLTDFGSGYTPELHPDIVTFKKEVWSDKVKRQEMKDEIEKIQKAMQAKLGRFGPEDFLYDTPLGVVEGINTSRKDLRLVNMERFKLQVEDADTIFLERRGVLNWLKARFGYGRIAMRISGLDAPEIKHEDDPLAKIRWEGHEEQPFGRESLEMFKTMLKKSTNIALVTEVEPSSYGRYIAAVADEHGKNIGLELIRRGGAKALPWGNPHLEIMRRDMAQAAEEEARAKHEGMWENERYRQHVIEEGIRNQEITFNTLTSLPRLAGSPYRYGELATRLDGMGEQGIMAHLRKFVTDFGSKYQGVLAISKWVYKFGERDAAHYLSQKEIKDLMVYLRSTIKQSQLLRVGKSSFGLEMTPELLQEHIATLRKLESVKGYKGGTALLKKEYLLSIRNRSDRVEEIKRLMKHESWHGAAENNPVLARKLRTAPIPQNVIDTLAVEEYGLSQQGIYLNETVAERTAMLKEEAAGFYLYPETAPIESIQASVENAHAQLGRQQWAEELKELHQAHVQDVPFRQAREARPLRARTRRSMTTDTMEGFAPVKPPNIRCDDSPGVEGYVQRLHRNRKNSHHM